MSNSEKHEHLKSFSNVDCVVAVTIKFRIRKQTSKPQIKYCCCLQFSYIMYLAPNWLIPCNIITFHKYFWCSRFCKFHSKWCHKHCSSHDVKFIKVHQFAFVQKINAPHCTALPPLPLNMQLMLSGGIACWQPLSMHD